MRFLPIGHHLIVPLVCVREHIRHLHLDLCVQRLHRIVSLLVGFRGGFELHLVLYILNPFVDIRRVLFEYVTGLRDRAFVGRFHAGAIARARGFRLRPRE